MPGARRLTLFAFDRVTGSVPAEAVAHQLTDVGGTLSPKPGYKGWYLVTLPTVESAGRADTKRTARKT